MRTVELKRGSVATYDDGSPFFVEAGTLDIAFKLPDPNGQYFVVDGRNKTLIPSDGRVSLSVGIGELRLAVKRYIGGRMVESYAVEPLQVESVDGTVTAFPELSVLQKKAVQLEKAMKEETTLRENGQKQTADELKKANEEVASVKKDAADAVHKLAVVFLRYAYTDYRRNVYINTRDVSFDGFLAALGFSKEDFTAEELAAIKEEAKI